MEVCNDRRTRGREFGASRVGSIDRFGKSLSNKQRGAHLINNDFHHEWFVYERPHATACGFGSGKVVCETAVIISRASSTIAALLARALAVVY